ncbi:MAG TPA: RNA polymerase sigma factor [Myxococcales bacterium]
MRWRQAGHRPKETPFEDAPEPVAPSQDDQPSLDDVLRALSRLSFNQRSALVMRELEGRSCKEIAETLGLSVSAVEALLFRARRRLQIERKALGVLGTAPLPGSVASALGIGGGGGGAAGSGLVALGGADAVLKGASALVIAGAIASGAVAIARPAEKYQPAAPQVRQVKQADKSAATPHAKGAPVPRTQRAKTRPAARPAARAATTSAAGSASTQTGQTVVQPAVQVPKLPKLPLPAPPIQVPSVQLPSLPVGLPPLPPVPPVPPLPPLPPL